MAVGKDHHPVFETMNQPRHRHLFLLRERIVTGCFISQFLQSRKRLQCNGIMPEIFPVDQRKVIFIEQNRIDCLDLGKIIRDINSGKSKNGKEIYYIMKESYLNECGKTMVQIAQDLSISETSCYRLKNVGFRLLSQYLWDIPIEVNRENNTFMSFYELFKEVCYG